MASKINDSQNKIKSYDYTNPNVQSQNNNSNSSSAIFPVGSKNSDVKKTGDNYTKSEVDYNQKLELFKKINNFESVAEVVVFGIERIDPNFGKLSAEEQYNKLLQFMGITDEGITKISQQTESEELEEYTDNETQFFDHSAFAKLSNEEKVKTFALELAKNRFLYADKDATQTEEEWNNLSGEQRQQLVQNEINNIVKEGSKDAFCDDAIGNTLEDKMLFLQAANKNRISFDELSSRDKKFDILSDYIYDFSESDNPENNAKLSERMLGAINERKNLSKIIIAECKAAGIEDFGNGEITLLPSEIKDYLVKIKKETGKNILELQIQYLQNRQEQGIPLSDDEKNNLEFFQNLKNGLDTVKNMPVQNYGRLDAFNKSEYAKYLNDLLSDKDKITVYAEYIEKNFSNLSPEEYAKAVGELSSEIMKDSNGKITGSLLYAKILREASPEQKQALAELNVGYSQVNNTVHINEYTPETASIVAETQNDNGLYELAMQRINISDDVHAHATSAIDSVSKSEDVQRTHKNRTFAVEDAKLQLDMSNNINNSNLNIRKEFSIETYKLQEENQAKVQEKLIEDKEVAKYSNEHGDISKFAKSQQVAIHKAYKDRFECDDFGKDEAIIQLNRLSDQIQNCDKNNQLAMHNEMMTSKYSEVQEHTAGNIKNYDISVQADAMDSVYKTGNQKAIDAGLKSIAEGALKASGENPQIDQTYQKHVEQEVINAIIQLAENDAVAEEAKEFKELFLSGKLSQDQISKLSTSEKREYYTNLFKKASAGQKLQWLSKLPSSQKQTIYTYVALYDKQLLRDMIQYSHLGEDMFAFCNDTRALRAIFNIMKNSDDGTVKDQFAEIQNNRQNSALFSSVDFAENEQQDRNRSLDDIDALQYYLRPKDKIGYFG